MGFDKFAHVVTASLVSENTGRVGQNRPDLPLEPHRKKTRFPAILVRNAGNPDAMNLQQHENRDDMKV